MSAFRKLQSRVTSFLLAITILLTSIPSVSAYTDANTGGSHGGGSATSKGTNFDGDSFIRVTLLFAENGDWENSAGIQQIGATLDMYNPKAGPTKTVTYVSDFSSKSNKPGFRINANTATAYNSGEQVAFGNYGYEHMKQYWGVSPKEMDNGQTLEFPILIGAKANGVNPKTFFSAKSVINQMLYVTQYAGGTYGTDAYLGNASDIMDGIYRPTKGNIKYGQFMFLLESGIYLNINGQYSATTTREAAQLDSKLSYVLSNNIAWPYKDSANNLYINDSWPMLKLDGTSGANSISSFWTANRSLTNKKFGVGIVTFKSISKPALPVVNYYYNLTEADLDRAGLALASDGETIIVKGDETETPLTGEEMEQYYGEVFNRKADNAKSFNSESLTEYTAPATEGEYQLAEGYMTAKEEIGGYLKVEDDSLQFFDAENGWPGVTNRLKTFLQDFEFTDDDIKNWYESRELQLTTEKNAKYSKLADEKHIQQTKTGGLIAKYGEGADKLQAVFLYYKAPFDIPTPDPVETYDDDFPIPNRITHVTKMYFEDKDATEPIEIKTEQISAFDTYEVKNDELNGESYKMTEWVIVADDTPKQPEPYTTWEEAKEHKAERDKNEGTTTGPLGPTNWSNPDSELFIKYVKQDVTNVTKMYYNKGDSTPERIETETVFKDEPYDITDEDEYKVVDWAIIEDTTPNTPEPYPTYDEAKQHVTNGSGTTPDKVDPDKWVDPDSELFIKYEKEEEEPQTGSLRLTEKRISWLKSLKDIGGIPTITFQWAAITGSETHYCGDEDCSGHSCNEHIGKDSFLRFVSSNTTPVKSDIMGNKSGFMPYDEDNVYEFNRTDDGGSYDMKPNYWYVIWRGKDIPTIASYKYGDTTGSGKATSAPIIKNLIGENMVGIKPAGARNANNNSFYMDSFTITEGKSNYDAKTLSAFVNSFGAQAGGVGDQAFANTLDEYHDISEQYEKAEEDVKIAEAEKNQRLSELEQAHRDHDRMEHIGNSLFGSVVNDRYEDCRICQNYQASYDAALADYNAKVVIRDGLKVKYTSLGDKLGGKKSQTGNGIQGLGDYDYSTKWSYCGNESWYSTTGGSQTFTPDVRVDVGYGTQNVGNAKVTFKSENLTAFGIDYTNVVGYPINNTAPIKFYPYVEMLYDTTTGLKDQKVYVLGGHESTLVPQDYVEVGFKTTAYNAEHGTGLLLESQQWSTHASALKLGSSLGNGGKNKVLPGGAIYRLRTPSENGKNSRTTVAISSWLTFLPSDTINATTSGKTIYTGTIQNNKNEEMYREILRSFNSLDVVQVVNNTQLAQEQAGSQTVVNGQKTSTSAKYWLKQNLTDGAGVDSVANAMKINSKVTNEADLDIVSQKEARTYYRIYSDVNGNVYVSKSTKSQEDTAPGKGQVIAKISKTQGLNDLLKVTEVKALNNRTNIVANYLSAIDRNIGNDVSLSDTKWYNEAFDGICVVRIDKQIELGFVDNNAASAARTSAIDPKLQPARTSQGGLFSASAQSYFRTDTHTNLSSTAGYIGTFKPGSAGASNVQINMKNMEGIYRSKTFLIPNVGVMDLF